MKCIFYCMTILNIVLLADSSNMVCHNLCCYTSIQISNGREDKIPNEDRVQYKFNLVHFVLKFPFFDAYPSYHVQCISPV